MRKIREKSSEFELKCNNFSATENVEWFETFLGKFFFPFSLFEASTKQNTRKMFFKNYAETYFCFLLFVNIEIPRKIRYTYSGLFGTHDVEKNWFFFFFFCCWVTFKKQNREKTEEIWRLRRREHFFESKNYSITPEKYLKMRIKASIEDSHVESACYYSATDEVVYGREWEREKNTSPTSPHNLIIIFQTR